jgi:hypothetical protein
MHPAVFEQDVGVLQASCLSLKPAKQFKNVPDIFMQE